MCPNTGAVHWVKSINLGCMVSLPIRLLLRVHVGMTRALQETGRVLL